MYADDAILSATSESTIEVQSRIKQDLLNARIWLVANKLSVNVVQTEYVFFGSNFRLFNHGKTIPISSSRRSKIGRSINGLRQARDYVDLDVLKTI